MIPSQIKLNPVIIQRTLRCPSCGEDIYQYSRNSSKVAGGGFWIDDGDTLPSIYEDLNNEQININSCCSLSVGKRPCCNNEYFIVEVQTIDSSICDSYEETIDWFQNNHPEQSEHTQQPWENFMASYHGDCPSVPKEWLVTAIATGSGICAFQHTFGPFKLDDTSIIGEHGVSFCNDSNDDDSSLNFALQLLDDLKDDFCRLTHHL